MSNNDRENHEGYNESVCTKTNFISTVLKGKGDISCCLIFYMSEKIQFLICHQLSRNCDNSMESCNDANKIFLPGKLRHGCPSCK